jgi:hypothetical protein
MGNRHPHFNVTSLSYIVCTSQRDLVHILQIYHAKIPQFEEDLQGDGEEKAMKVSKNGFSEILMEANVHDSGQFNIIVLDFANICCA